jgi:hypothetical protein
VPLFSVVFAHGNVNIIVIYNTMVQFNGFDHFDDAVCFITFFF